MSCFLLVSRPPDFHSPSFQPQEAFSLLAYRDPHTCPLSYLLQEEQREGLANELNTAILGTHFIRFKKPKSFRFLRAWPRFSVAARLVVLLPSSWRTHSNVFMDSY